MTKWEGLDVALEDSPSKAWACSHIIESQVGHQRECQGRPKPAHTQMDGGKADVRMPGSQQAELME